jgi:5-formyltetrahydrofolate cyclo-ligase
MAAELKKSLREEALRRRDAIPLPVRRAKDAAIRERLYSLPEYRDAARVLLYASFRSEADTFSIIEDALSSGKRVMLPKVEGERLAVYEIKGIGDAAPGYMGIPEPPASQEVGLDDVDMVIMPGAAFDIKGWRLGYGKGYYDRLGATAPRVAGPAAFFIALAYEEQMADGIPAEEHDVAVDVIITDKRILRCHEYR